MKIVSEPEIRRQLREMGARNPLANELLRKERQGRLSLQDALYWLLLDERERSRRRSPARSPDPLY